MKNKLIAEKMKDLTTELVKNYNEKERHFTTAYSLTSTEYKFLYNFTSESKIAVKDLARSLGVTPARITHIITALEKREFITRNIDANDRRSILVSLTEKGLPLVKEISEYHIQLHSKILATLDIENKDMAISILEELIKAIRVGDKTK